MTLDDAQKKKVAAWLAEGLKLSEIQNRLASELGLQMTYMDVRLLVDDLKLVPKDIEPPKPAAPIGSPPTATPGASGGAAPAASQPERAGPIPGTRDVSVTVDQIARPGAIVSGQVTFSDGNTAAWYLDETNRLGLVPKQQGYRPSAADVQQFQMALQEELSKY